MNIVQGNLLEQRGILCQQVNMEGFMNKGLARDIRDKWPRVYQVYHVHNAVMGNVLFVQAEEGVMIANIYAQHYSPAKGKKTNYGALAYGLVRVREKALELDMPIYIPFGMGCGLGGGDWSVVTTLIDYLCPKAIVMQWDEKVLVTAG